MSEPLLTDEEREAIIETYGDDISLFSLTEDIAKAQLEKIVANRPSNKEIKMQIINCLYGGMSVPELERWLKEHLLVG